MTISADTVDLLRMVWKGPVAEFLEDPTEQIDLEGAIRSGKTTAALWKVLNSCLAHPGIHWLICRYSDGDTSSKLRPVFEQIAYEAGVPLTWHHDRKYYMLPNEARVYAFGLKAQTLAERYAKFRGVTLASIYNDQTEELPYDIYQELIGRLSQRGYPQQIVLTPNPMDDDSWLATEFPEDNHIRHRKYFRVSIYDNAHNLDLETVERLERVYPPGHVKYGPMLLGLRGMNVTGQPVYGAVNVHEPETAAFQRSRHERPLDMDPSLPLYESIDYGKHHPCVVWAQYTPWGDLHALGGVMGHHLYLEDFAPIVQQYRTRWFPNALEIATCCDPAGAHDNSQGLKQNGVSVLTDHGFSPTYKPDSNSPAVRLGMIERIAGHMRRRSPRGESFGIDRERWVRVSASAAIPHRFLADGCEAGYVWDPRLISVGSKQMRRPKKDGWFEHGQNCLEYLEHNYGGVQPTLEQTVQHAASVRAQQTKQDRLDTAELAHQLMMRREYGIAPPRRSGGLSRGGY